MARIALNSLQHKKPQTKGVCQAGREARAQLIWSLGLRALHRGRQELCYNVHPEAVSRAKQLEARTPQSKDLKGSGQREGQQADRTILVTALFLIKQQPLNPPSQKKHQVALSFYTINCRSHMPQA